MTGGLVITEASVLRDGRLVARLHRLGEGTVVLSLDARPRRLGRIWPSGYMQGHRNAGSYDAWTAKHPSVHTPSDVIIAEGLPLAGCVAAILEGAGDEG